MDRRAATPYSLSPMNSRIHWPATCALIASIVAWASMPVFLRALTKHVDPFTANGIRYPIAAIAYWPVLVYFYRRGQIDRALLFAIIPAALMSLAGQILFAMTPYYITANSIGFMIKTSTIWVLLGAMVLFPDERRILTSPRFWIGLAIALVGLLGLAQAEGAFDVPATALGIALTLGCAFFYGLYALCVRRFLQGVHPILAFALVCQLVAAGCLVAFYYGAEPEAVEHINGEGWSLLFVSAFAGIALSHSVYFVSIKYLGATISASGQLLGPFITSALAWVFLEEAMSDQGWWSGTILVVGGGILISTQGLMRRGLDPEESDDLKDQSSEGLGSDTTSQDDPLK